ncbi:Cysteine desulfurase IscS [bioreactor metagenome]|uniref:Cysteine desulfurase IscS n=1 Tax=bioreactor metagenome TaxID=1076179 RepID=A0A644VJ47_9ZZZZ|nr:aminotransferase class V-fold PLP-dependent enzyme [Acidaminococcaceae bacterium]
MDKSYFPEDFIQEIKEKFYYVDEDNLGRKRLFFENSGGSLRLKAAVEAKCKYEKIPDCPERYHDISMHLRAVKEKGIIDLLEIVFGAKPGEGALITELTASQVMFRIVRAIVENTPGTNIVTTSIEHPSAHDAAKFYAKRTGKEFRVAMANNSTGGVDVEEIMKHVDKNTCMLSVMSASNVSGNILPMADIVKAARAVNLYLMLFSICHILYCTLVNMGLMA